MQKGITFLLTLIEKKGPMMGNIVVVELRPLFGAYEQFVGHLFVFLFVYTPISWKNLL